jgi:hypothetical protein
MSMLARVGLAALVSLAVVSNATAQKVKSQHQVKPFTAGEKLYFERASVMTGGAAGGGGGGGGDGGQ